MRVVKKPAVVNLESSGGESDDENAAVKHENSSKWKTSANLIVPLDVSGELLACRVCLATDVKLYNLHGCKLADRFGEFTGTPVSKIDGLPQHLCFMCRSLLLKAVAFRVRCRNTHCSLQNIMMWTPRLSTQVIRNIDKTDFKLPLIETLPLTLEYIDVPDGTDKPDSCDVRKLRSSTKPPELVQKKKNSKKAVKTNKPIIETNFIDVSKPEMDIPKEEFKNFDLDLGDIKKSGSDGEHDYDVSLEFELESLEDIKPVKNETETPKAKRSKTETKPPKRNAYVLKDKEDYDNFAATFNVEVVHLTVDEQQQELTAKRNSENFINCEYKCELCCKMFKDETNCRKHSERHDASNGEFECEICRLRFRQKRSWALHLQVHSNVRYRCTLCGHLSRQTDAAVRHFQSHGGDSDTTFECEDCHKIFKDRVSQYKHVRHHHTPRHCPICSKSFSGDLALSVHRLVHQQAHKCSSCNAGFKSTDALEKHQCGKRSCMICGEGFETEEHLKKHKLEAHQTKKCVECDFSCSSEQKLDQHWASEHKGRRRPGKARRRPYKSPRTMCEICAKVLTQHDLSRHMLRHTSEKTHQCSFCEKRFWLKWHLREHENRHTGERPHKCAECPATFTTYVEKSQHKARVHMDKKFKCRLCKLCFVNDSSLKKHEMKHEPVPQQCGVCMKQFFDVFKLKEHMKRHGKTRGRTACGKQIHRCKFCPATFTSTWKSLQHKAEVHNAHKMFECDTCGKKFLIKPELVKHFKSHSSERPYACTLCPKTYRTEDNLREHMNIHTGAKPYKCTLCSETFNTYWKRYEHRMRVHLKTPIRRKRS